MPRSMRNAVLFTYIMIAVVVVRSMHVARVTIHGTQR